MSSDSFRRDAAPSQSPAGADEFAAPSTTVDVDLEVLRRVIAEQGWTLESVAAAMGRTESYRSHISRVLDGERPFSHDFKKALPDDIEGAYHAQMAEEFGYVAAKPAVDPKDAERKALSAAAYYLRTALPAKASSMARAVMNVGARKRA